MGGNYIVNTHDHPDSKEVPYYCIMVIVLKLDLKSPFCTKSNGHYVFPPQWPANYFYGCFTTQYNV